MASDEYQYGRWYTPDLLGGDITNPQSLNRYAYALNNPTTLTDPSGLDSCTIDGQPGICITSTDVGPGDPMLEMIWEMDSCLNPLSGCPYDYYQQNEGSPSLGGGGGGGGVVTTAPKPAPPSFTLGLRVPNQTFNQCMTQNATNYSAGGFADLALGTNNVFSNPYAQVATGNTATSLYAGVFGGSASNAAGAATSTTPDLFKTAIGSPLSYGRRTANIMTLNLEGKGGLPLALSPVPEIGELTSALGSVSRAFSLGLDFAEKGAADIGLFGAEAVGCSISQ